VTARRPRRTTTAADKAPIAPMDPLTRKIQRVLDLIGPVRPANTAKYDGYCGVATEAYLHLSGKRPPRLQVRSSDNGYEGTHWWLLDVDRGVIDVTLSAAERRLIASGDEDPYAYENGVGKMFRNGYARPSKRAQVIIDLVRSLPD
jgi:hypothetical protein